MTHTYLALKNYSQNGQELFEKGHQYLMSDASAEELKTGELIEKKIITELTAEEGLALYKKQ